MSYFLWEDECPDPPALFSGTLQPGLIHLLNSTVPSLPASDPFCSLGDALSVAGCGWHLEDTAQQMYQSLAKTLGTLPPQTVSLGLLGGSICLTLDFLLVLNLCFCACPALVKVMWTWVGWE